VDSIKFPQIPAWPGLHDLGLLPVIEAYAGAWLTAETERGATNQVVRQFQDNPKIPV